MEQLIEKYWASTERLVYAEAYKQGVPVSTVGDVLQETLIRLLRYPPKMESAKDPKQFFLGAVRRNAMQVIYKMQGLRKDRPAVKEQGLRNTFEVGLFQELTDGETSLMDERMLPTVPSAEDAYLSTIPNRRQAALREAIGSLPELQRMALTHQFYEELSVAESASLLRVSETAVQNARAAGMRKLKTRLNPRGRKILQDA
jgi:RNA polymerase sigma factor (sigma-70 family)